MTFQKPEFLWALLLLAPYAAAELLSIVRGGTWARILAPHGEAERSGRVWRRRRFARSLAGAWAWAFTVGALAGPSWGSLPSSGVPSGVEAALVVDVSNSMLSSDVPPSRLSVAQDTARSLIRMREDASFLVVAFKGSATLLCPVTDDPDALDQALDWAVPSALSAAGTSVASGIQAALAGFSSDPGLAKYIVLFSDGDDLAGGMSKASRDAKERGVRILTVGCGASEEIPARNESGDVVKRADGSAARTALRASALRQWAAETGGLYADASDPSTLNTLSDALDSRPGAGGARTASRPADRTAFFALLALLGVMVRAWASMPRGGARLHNRAAAVLLACLGLSGCSVPHFSVLRGNLLAERGRYEEAIAAYLGAGTEENDRVVVLNLGTVYSHMGERAAAQPLYERAQESPDPRVAAAAFHDRGVQLFETFRYEEAAESFKKALRLVPGDLETKRALELALSTIEASVSPMSRQSVSAEKGGRDEALFSLLRRAESDWFRPAEAASSENEGADY